MGKHSEYWKAYGRGQVRASLRLVLAIGAWIVAAAVAAASKAWLGGMLPWVLGTIFSGLIVTIVRMGKDAYKVLCPECATTYRRNKWGGECPGCGLKLLQADPAPRPTSSG